MISIFLNDSWQFLQLQCKMSYIPYIHQAHQINLGFSVKNICKTKTDFNIIYNHKKIKQLLFFDGRNLFNYDYGKEIILNTINFYDQFESCQVVCGTYSEEFDIYILLVNDWKIHLLRKNLSPLYQVQLELKQFILGMHFIDDKKSLVLIGVYYVEEVFFNIQTNIKTVFFPSSIKFSMIPTSKQQLVYKSKSKQNKGHYIYEDYLFLWEPKHLKIYSFEQASPIQEYRDLTTKTNTIISFLYMPKFSYFLGGLYTGDIQVWRQKNNGKSLHNFEGNFNQGVVSLESHPQDDEMFWSISQDLQLKLWSLRSWACVQNFQIRQAFQNVAFVFSGHLLCANETVITSVRVKGTQESIMHTGGAQVIWQSATKDQLVFVFENNSGILLGAKKGIFYPPPKSKPIQRIYHSPFQQDNYYMLMHDGAVARVRMQDETGLFVSGVKSGEILDSLNHPVNAQVETIAFLQHLKPPMFDAEITTKQLSNLKTNEQIVVDLGKDLICFGMSNGTIIFVEKENLKKIYARLSFHREKIVQVCELYKEEQQRTFLLSLDAEHLLRITYFENNRPQQYQTINTMNCINQFMSKDHYLFIGSRKGDLQVFKLKNNQLSCYINNEGQDHDGPLVGLQLFEQKLILTAGSDERIKLWTFRKILLVQILLEQEIKAAGLISQTQLYLTFDNQISKVQKEVFSFQDGEIKEINSKMKQIRQNSYGFEEYCLNYNNLQKLKQKISQVVSFTEDENQNQNPIQNQTQIQPTEQFHQKSLMQQSQNTEAESEFQANQSFYQEFDIRVLRKSRVYSRQSRGNTGDYRSSALNHQDFEKKQEDSYGIITNYENNKFKFRSKLPALPQTEEKQRKTKIEQFTQNRLLKNKVQTRRDITINRIILKNLLKEELQDNAQRAKLQPKNVRSASHSFY